MNIRECLSATVLLVLIGLSNVALAQSPTPFVPEDFHVPETLETPEFRLRMLSVGDVVKDYDAVMTSAGHVSEVWPGSTWPTGLTLEQNLIDLGWHQKEFQRRNSFAFTVVSPSEDRVLGCVYIDPTRKKGYDAEIYLWARQSELANGLDARLYETVEKWVAKEWPFKRPGFPGRSIKWESWNEIKTRSVDTQSPRNR